MTATTTSTQPPDNQGTFPPMLFISFARADRVWVDRIVQDLNASGHQCWVDREVIEGGERWTTAIHSAIAQAEAVLVVITPGATGSPWVARECLLAQERDKRLIPVLVGPCELPFYLKEIRPISLHPDYGAGLQRLLRALGGPSSPVLVSENAGRIGLPEAYQALRMALTEDAVTAVLSLDTITQIIRQPPQDLERYHLCAPWLSASAERISDSLG